MGDFKITKGKLIDVPQEDRHNGIVAFQMVRFEFDFFGNMVESVQDTKIMENGDQIVINGDGYIKAGYKIA